jgi:hypothetical protein
MLGIIVKVKIWSVYSAGRINLGKTSNKSSRLLKLSEKWHHDQGLTLNFSILFVRYISEASHMTCQYSDQ